MKILWETDKKSSPKQPTPWRAKIRLKAACRLLAWHASNPPRDAMVEEKDLVLDEEPKNNETQFGVYRG